MDFVLDYADALRITISERRVAPFLIEHGAEEFHLQLAGIGLLETGEVRNPAARSAVDAILAALARREWFGDEILSEWLSDAVNERHVALALPVNVEDLSWVLEGEQMGDVSVYLDLRTGEQAFSDPDNPDETEEDDHLLFVPPNYWRGASWRDRLKFTDWVEDERLAERLIDALDGKRAYRRFRYILEDYPSLNAHFQDFANDRQLCRAVRWLNGEGIRVAVGGNVKAV
jgi:hypothetical protein